MLFEITFTESSQQQWVSCWKDCNKNTRTLCSSYQINNTKSAAREEEDGVADRAASTHSIGSTNVSGLYQNDNNGLDLTG